MIVSLLLALLCIVLAIIFLMGKGDNLIAGYNTATEEERQEVNIKRLRLLMAIMMVVTAAFCGCLSSFGKDMDSVLGATVIFGIITIVFLILANTWAKKK